jgi:small subunit ribosomal protein S9
MKKTDLETKTKETKTATSQKTYYMGIGRRKEAVARVKLITGGQGEIMVNNIPVEKYFSSALFENIYSEPFKITNTQGRFTVDVKISGSGNKGQLKAMVHGIARALVLVDPEKNKTILRRRGLLTRDPRTRERRKIGHGGKARREKQSPKR